MSKKQRPYCYDCGKHPIGYGDLYENGFWHPICGICYNRRAAGACITLSGLLARGAYILRRNPPLKKAPQPVDTQTVPLWEQGGVDE